MVLKRIFYNDQNDWVRHTKFWTDKHHVNIADANGWTEINEEKMVGIPPVGPRELRPLPVPGMVSSKGPHKHCVSCWSEDVDDLNKCLKCRGDGIMCYPAFCGSS